ncbi:MULTISPECIES: hypothetical protein [Oceanobacillus]|uniref:DUF4064 domain-containing protein n=1 Tax=Oceanobacillus kimchii TaxID=746691 RepID=A0ABQ5TF03_9BACI|nr:MULTISPECIES: hypothetical protein [Oceanobacillus]MBT2599306.1 hypothetical protein [Oceanobacillus sp. ISL-74]MBT2652224.1 hypothetical protein [Oceanobacillus sp. ISL-73]GLO65433.1 hypothetical protein MACH08_12170 [Oceanobacillus kimchii]
MRRKAERRLLFVGATWNLITSLLTIFSYNTWFQAQGKVALEGAEAESLVMGASMLDNISKVIMTFGLFVFVGAIINFLIAVKLKDNTIQKTFLIWIGVWTAIQLASMDILGFVIYLLVFIIYIAKNKAIRLSANAD